MSLGPAWLRHELPQPIAAAWHFATLDTPVDGLAAAAAVEVALRVVTGLQLAAWMQQGKPLPDMVRNGFHQPSLGSWIRLVLELRDGLDKQRVALRPLASWPTADVEALLRRVLERRNALAHSGAMAPIVRRDAELDIAEATALVLETLGWLRAAPLLLLLEAETEGDSSIGRKQVFRGQATHPEPEPIRWRGAAKVRHLYLDTPAGLLDVEPFLDRDRLVDAPSEAIIVWAGFGKRGDVILRDDFSDKRTFRALTNGPRLVPVTWQGSARRPTDATIHQGLATGERERRADATRSSEATRSGEATRSKVHEEPRRSRRWIAPVAVGLLLIVGIAVAYALGRGGADAVAGPAAVEGTPEVAAAKPTCAAALDLGGTWSFDAEVRGSTVRGEANNGVHGLYLMRLMAARECHVPGRLEKLAFTMDDVIKDNALTAELDGVVSPRGRTVAFRTLLRDGKNGQTPVDLSMRLARHGDRLIGVWRYEGEWRSGLGYWGVIYGVKGGDMMRRKTLEPTCVQACVDACYGGADPLAISSEKCVLGCAPLLDDCRD